MKIRTSKILIVSDNDDIFSVMKSYINDNLTETLVLSSHSENEALKIVETEEIDVVLIDLSKSKLDGFEICKKIKDDQLLSDIPVGLITTMDEFKVNRIKALEYGAETLIIRPIDENDFIAQIRALIKIRIKNIEKRNEKQELIDSIKSDHTLIEAIFDSIPGYLYVYDEEGKLIKWNKKHETMTGYSSDELSQMTMDKWFDSEDMKKVNTTIQKVFNEGYGEVEANLILKNRDKMFVRSSGSPLVLNNRNYIAGIGLDITEQKRIENELKKSESFNSNIIESTHDGFWVVNTKGQLLLVNQSYCRMTGYTRDELMSMHINDLDVNECPKDTELHIKNVIENGSDLFNTRHKKKDGNIIDIEVSATYSKNDNVIFAFCRDITDRLQKELIIKESENKFRFITENIKDVISIYNVSKSKFTYISPSIFSLRGFTVEEALSGSLVTAVSTESTELVSKIITNNINDFLNNPNTTNNYVNQIKQPCKDGRDIWVEISTSFNYNSEGDLEALSVSRSIDEWKRAEEKLIQSEELYKSLFEYSGLAVGFYKPDGTIISYNQLAIQNMGGDIQDYSGKSIYEVFPKASADFYMNRILKAINSESSEEYIDFVSLAPGDKWFSSTFTRIVDHNDDVIGVQIISKDITQTINMENALKASERKYRLITENGSDVITIYNISKNIHTYISPSVQKMRGYTVEEVRTMKFQDSIDPELFEYNINILNKNMDDFLHNPQTTNNYRYETRQSCKNGQYIWVEVSSFYQYNDENELETVNNLRNIEERKIVEERLRESEEKYRLITENVSDVISVYNITKNRFEYISPSIMTLRGLTVEEAMNERLEDGRLPEERTRLMNNLAENIEEFKNNPSKSKLIVSQEQTICKNGDLIWIELSIRFHLNAEGDILSTALIRNIEDRKKSEEKMKHLSYHDQLTNLYNRRFYEEELMRLDTERNLPIALIMADVNGLKLTNDAFGHQEGDKLLKNISELFKKVCRSDEIISRIGGDEFVILLPKCNDKQARMLIDRINEAISKARETNALLSVSMGYAVKESVQTKMDVVYKEAEDDMYRHKLAENLSMRSKNINLIMNSLFEKSQRERLHSDRVAEICEKIALNMNFNQEEVQQIRLAAVLHDIGKIGINDSILNKNGKLDTNEWEEMKKHSEIGYRILSTVSEFSEIAEYVLSHQERWDGRGYPDKLKGEEIPVQSRIIAIADAYDAMTVKRSYRDAMSESEAIAEIKKYAGTQFDPEIARIFVEIVMNLPW